MQPESVSSYIASADNKLNAGQLRAKETNIRSFGARWFSFGTASLCKLGATLVDILRCGYWSGTSSWSKSQLEFFKAMDYTDFYMNFHLKLISMLLFGLPCWNAKHIAVAVRQSTSTVKIQPKLSSRDPGRHWWWLWWRLIMAASPSKPARVWYS